MTPSMRSASASPFDAGPLDAAVASERRLLRSLVTAVGAGWCVLFVVLALAYDLQFYGDGALFSYAIAVRDAWTFHWHNIAGRSFVYLLAYVPAEAYAALTQNVAGALTLYAILFFSAPLVGLAATFGLDRTPTRTFFTMACASTAVVLPFVFGFPTEMWVAHALFWPALTLAMTAPGGWPSRVAIALLLTAVGMTHGGGMLLAFAIVGITALRGLRHPVFRRALLCLVPAAMVWILFFLVFKPDAYIAAALHGAAYTFIDPANFDMPFTRLLAVALLAYAGLYALGTWLGIRGRAAIAGLLVAAGLGIYWRLWDDSVLTDMRYPLRTGILVVTPLLGALAAAVMLQARRRIGLFAPHVEATLGFLARYATPRALAGAFLLVTLAHAVETGKFVTGWIAYEKSVRELAAGPQSDPGLGDARFVSATRIGAAHARYGWGSTTHFLTVLLAPGMRPAKLVVDPDTNYFWLSCAKATASLWADRPVPTESRALIRTHACRHRPPGTP
ncbi:MAG: hypothetical protein EKK41_21900 [Hyphomicrobiales bacterium]|nr:MAG: hypothetical protein EKK41_21900 [Hyphomicrobiales bacterium]